MLIDGAEGREKRVEDAAGDKCSLLWTADADRTEKRGWGAACMLDQSEVRRWSLRSVRRRMVNLDDVPAYERRRVGGPEHESGRSADETTASAALAVSATLASGAQR